MKNIFYFGEQVDGYDVKVLNERENRAGAGIMFLFAIIMFLTSCLSSNFFGTKFIIILFLIDFFIRVIINPKFAPTLILGRFFVSNQKPEYVGASQKKFAWALGLGIAIVMFYLLVLNNTVNPLTMILCVLCLVLLFFETAFGICIGCKIYNLLHKEKAKFCPGGICEVVKKEKIQKISLTQITIIILFFAFMSFIYASDLLKTKDLNGIVIESQNSTGSVIGGIKSCMSTCDK